MKFKNDTPAVFLFMLLLCGLPAFATQMIPLPIEKLANASHLALHGTVTGKSCQRDGEGRIYTKITLQVAEVWKGQSPPADFVVVQGGGVLGEEASVVSGQAEFEVGEEVALFLVLNRRGEGVVVGLSQGKFRIWKDKASGQRMASNRIHGGPFPGKSGVAPPGPRGTNRLTLSELKQRVRGGRP